MKYDPTNNDIRAKAQEIALAKLGREITPNDIRLFSVLNKATTSYNIADNRYFDEELEAILDELHSSGHISYDKKNSSIRIKRSFYDFMIEVLQNTSEDHKVR